VPPGDVYHRVIIISRANGWLTAAVGVVVVVGVAVGVMVKMIAGEGTGVSLITATGVSVSFRGSGASTDAGVEAKLISSIEVGST
jgi:hypothetical protein